MAYQFHKPKSANKPIHIVLTSLLAVLAVTILVAWLSISYLQNRPIEPQEPADDSDVYVETVTEPATCLVVLDIEDNHQFLIIQTIPESNRVMIAAVPATLDTGTDDTLNALLQRNGPVKVMQTIANRMELPITQYICLSASGVNKFVTELENGVSVKLPEPITYTDENGITSTLSSGTNNLTAGQATAVLSHTKWKKPHYASLMTTRIIKALINDYLTTDYSLKGYFGVLSNVAQTNLRIDNFTAYAPALTQLAENNTGDIAKVVELDGKTKSGRFIPDIDSCRKNSGLYH